MIVHNYLDQAKQVQLSLDVNGLDPVSGASQSVTVPQGRRHRALASEGIAYRHWPSARQSPYR